MRAAKKKRSVPLPSCDLCMRDQAALGAILYGPPETVVDRVVSEKTHVCVECYDKIFQRVS